MKTRVIFADVFSFLSTFPGWWESCRNFLIQGNKLASMHSYQVAGTAEV